MRTGTTAVWERAMPCSESTGTMSAQVSFSMTLAQFQLPSPVEFFQPGFENLGYLFVAVK